MNWNEQKIKFSTVPRTFCGYPPHPLRVATLKGLRGRVGKLMPALQAMQKPLCIVWLCGWLCLFVALSFRFQKYGSLSLEGWVDEWTSDIWINGSGKRWGRVLTSNSEWACWYSLASFDKAGYARRADRWTQGWMEKCSGVAQSSLHMLESVVRFKQPLRKVMKMPTYKCTSYHRVIYRVIF